MTRRGNMKTFWAMLSTWRPALLTWPSPLTLSASLLLSLLTGCRAEPTRPQTGSETHFLSFCVDGESCGAGLQCLCGACTRECTRATQCNEFADAAECAALESTAGCSNAVSTCDLLCEDDADCAPLDGEHRCDLGTCRQLALSCERGQTAANDVVLIGDQFIANTHELTTALEALARDTGALDSDASYRDHSSAAITPFGGANDLASQYVTAVDEGAPKVVIMNSGGPNALATCPDPPTAECATLVEAVEGTEALWDTMAADGVEVVVDFFYPDPVDPTLKAKFDVLRQLLSDACDQSPVACHFVDLRPAFAEHPEYLEAAGILPTTEGSIAAAELLFSVMQRNCIAQ